MFNSPEFVFIFLFSIVATISATKLWNDTEKGNKKTEQLPQVGQRFNKIN